MNQRGFATLEVILMVMVIGILASIAVPRFGNVTAAANTAKIQADLSTIDTAIAIAIMEGKDTPSKLSDLKDYINDAENLKPPTGKCYMGGDEPVAVPATSYTIATVDSELRAVLGSTNTSGSFYKKSSTTQQQSNG